MKRSASQENEKRPAKVQKVLYEEFDLVNALPDELFNKILKSALKIGNGTLVALALTNPDNLEYIRNWSYHWVHAHPLELTDFESNELCALALSFAENILVDENFDVKGKAFVLSNILTGLVTPKTLDKVYNLVNSIEISESVRRQAIERILWLSYTAAPFKSNIKLTVVIENMIVAGMYRYLFSYIYLIKETPEAAHVFGTTVDIFIADYGHYVANNRNENNHDIPAQSEFIKALIKHFPELWAAKFQQLCDVISIWSIDEDDQIEDNPIYEAIRALAGDNQLLYFNNDLEISRHIQADEQESQTYFYSLILTGLTSEIFHEIDVYYQRMIRISPACSLFLESIFENIQIVFHRLTAAHLKTWNWIMKDLLQQYFHAQRPELTNRLLFRIYLEKQEDQTIQFIYGCFHPNSNYFEKHLELYLKHLVEKNHYISDHLTPKHLAHIQNLFSDFDDENCQTPLKTLLTRDLERMVALRSEDLVNYFKTLLKVTPNSVTLFVDLVNESDILRRKQSVWILMEFSPELEGELKQILV